MKNYIRYLTRSESQVIATWIQTVFLAVGVVYGMTQLSYMSDEQSEKKNQRHFEYYKQYLKSNQYKVEKVSTFYQKAAAIDDPEKLDKSMLDDIKVYETELVEYFTDLTVCHRLGLCPESTAQLVCSDAVWLHQNLVNAESIAIFKPERTTWLGWKYKALLGENCSFIQSFAYKLGIDV